MSSQEEDFFLSDYFFPQVHNKNVFCSFISLLRHFILGFQPSSFLSSVYTVSLKEDVLPLQVLNFLHYNNHFYLRHFTVKYHSSFNATTEGYLTLGPSSEHTAQSKKSWIRALQTASCSFPIWSPTYSIFTILQISPSTFCHNSEFRKCFTMLPSSALWKSKFTVLFFLFLLRFSI